MLNLEQEYPVLAISVLFETVLHPFPALALNLSTPRAMAMHGAIKASGTCQILFVLRLLLCLV